MAYSATWIGWESLRLDNFSHNVDLSFPLQYMSQPAVDFLRVSFPLTTIFWSSTQRAEPFFLWLMNSSYSGVTTCSLPKMGNILAFCNSSSYGSYCNESSTPSSTRSLTIAWGQASSEWTSWMIYVQLCTLPVPILLGLVLIMWTYAWPDCSLLLSLPFWWPISILGPRYLPI